MKTFSTRVLKHTKIQLKRFRTYAIMSVHRWGFFRIPSATRLHEKKVRVKPVTK